MFTAACATDLAQAAAVAAGLANEPADLVRMGSAMSWLWTRASISAERAAPPRDADDNLDGPYRPPRSEQTGMRWSAAW
ncbi:hypothetical protein BG844_24610 [Couchioplanes caeruleus subsp. caeruleus]|uniref:Uncharacterized protein n=1 Tax=Couchioplanes caeruleus subsp. caeruleus TaxID=56427 RepID=A0A1K0FFV3_9ACTN|nr:hypothetical protein BG844_24610 [Couchioplanes caeruleus subsp. caeruleus]